jgi:hypothetical protein
MGLGFVNPGHSISITKEAQSDDFAVGASVSRPSCRI